VYFAKHETHLVNFWKPFKTPTSCHFKTSFDLWVSRLYWAIVTSILFASTQIQEQNTVSLKRVASERRKQTTNAITG